MKKKFYKTARHLMRKFARWFLGFWDCPKDCRKNRKQRAINGLLNLTLAIFATLIFALLVIYSS